MQDVETEMLQFEKNFQFLQTDFKCRHTIYCGNSLDKNNPRMVQYRQLNITVNGKSNPPQPIESLGHRLKARMGEVDESASGSEGETPPAPALWCK